MVTTQLFLPVHKVIQSDSADSVDEVVSVAVAQPELAATVSKSSVAIHAVQFVTTALPKVIQAVAAVVYAVCLPLKVEFSVSNSAFAEPGVPASISFAESTYFA